MTKFAVTADLHLHSLKDFGRLVTVTPEWADQEYTANSRLIDQFDCLHEAFGRLKSKGVIDIFIVGDIFHVRGGVPNDVMTLATRFFQYWVRQGLHFITLAGNHDQMDKEGKFHSSAMFNTLFKRVTPGRGVVSYSDPAVHIHLISYQEDVTKLRKTLELERSLSFNDPKITHYLLLHAGVDGAEIGTLEYRMKEPLVLEDLYPQDWEGVFLGHFHKPQQMGGNVWYVGSPYQLTRAECGDVKRIMIVDTETGRVSQIRTHGKQFYTINMSGLESSLSPVDPGYYDIVVEEDDDLARVRELTLKLGMTDTHLVHKRKAYSQKSRLKVSEGASDKKLLRSYLRFKGQDTLGFLEFGLQAFKASEDGGHSSKEILFKRVIVENFLSIGEARLNLNSPGRVIALVGENLDADGFESNGAGKSSLLPEAVCWCLFGNTIRDLPADKVVNNLRKRNCKVQLVMEIDGQRVDVIRYRKHKSYSNSVRLFIDRKDVSQGENKATQLMINKLVGMTMDSFSSILAFSPDSLKFVTAPDSDKKQILDSILRTDRIQSALDYSKDKLRGVTTKASEIIGDVSVLTSIISTLHDTIIQLQEERAAHRESYANDQKVKKGKIKELGVDRDVLQKDLLAATEETQKCIGALTALRDSDIGASMAELVACKDTTQKQFTEVDRELTVLDTNISNLSKQISALADSAGSICPKCKQTVSPQHVGKIRGQMDAEIRVLKAKRVSVLARRDDLAETLGMYSQKIYKADEKEREIKKATSQVASANTIQSKIAAELDLMYEKIRSVKNSKVTDPELLTPLIRSKSKERADKVSQKEAMDLTLEELSKEADTIKFWVDGFGNKGLKSFMLDSIIPTLTEYANGYAEQLTEGGIDISFSTYGDGTDKFNVSASNSEGSDIYSGNSSGERRRVDICVMFALFRLANESTRMNVLLLDELFDTLDQTGTENVVTMLQGMAQELDLTIFVTSHSNLNLQDKITVTKQDKIATISSSL